MEDGQGDVAPGASGGVAESPLSGNFPSETLVENMGNENRVEESYEERDEGEIMVEIVGSDVFVDGVSSHKEGNFESGEVGDLGGPWENKEEPGTDNMDISTEGDGDRMGESEVGLPESKDERNLAATEEVGVGFGESVDVEGGACSALSSRGFNVSAHEVRNPGTEEVPELTSVVGEEKMIEDEAVDKNIAEFETPETSNHSLEADGGGKAEVAEKEEVLPSNDNAAIDDHLSVDSVARHGVANEARDGESAPSELSVGPNIDDSESVKVGGIDSVVGEVRPDSASAGGETLATFSPKDVSFRANTEPTNTDGDNVVESKSAEEKEVSAMESKDQILESDELGASVQDENQNSLNEIHDVKFEANAQIDGASHAIPESIPESSLESEKGETIGAESCEENDECLKNDGDVETDVVNQNHVLSSEPNEMTDEGGTAELSEDKGLNTELQADTEGNQGNTTSPGNPAGEQIVEAESDVHLDQPIVASTVGEVMDDHKVAIFQVEAVDKIESEIPKQSLECQGNAEFPVLDGSTDNMDLTETSSCPNVETADIGVIEDYVVNSEVGCENVVEENCLPENTEQEVSVQTMETSNQDVNKLESINVMPNEVSTITAVSDSTQVNVSVEKNKKVELLVSTIDSFLHDGGVIEEISMCDVATSSGEANKLREADDNSSKTDDVYIEEGHNSEMKPIDGHEEMSASHKRKHTLEDNSEARKERSLTELMGDQKDSPDVESARKRRALDPLADGIEKKESVSEATKVYTSASQTPKPSFKIGECIQRVASQLTGSTHEAIDGSESFSVNEMLSQLRLVGQDPKKRHNFYKNIQTFFMGFRSSIALNKRVRKKKGDETIGGSGEEFEFDDVNDSYWTDRIVQNYSEEQLLQNSENGAQNLQLVPFGAEKSVKPGRKPNSRKRYSTGSYPTETIEVDESIKSRKQESSPAELILHFAERNFVPSEININKMFRRFGPLMESETEVDHESGRAKVIFKRGADAEIARNSSEKFKIFGPALVNYQIGYSPLISVKILPLEIPQGPEDATLLL